MTITMNDVAGALGVSEAGVRKWFNRMPMCSVTIRRVPHFRADEAIVRLRGARKRGCDSDEAFAILKIDAKRRNAEPSLPLGADCERRAAELRACLTELELSRYLAVRGALHAGLIGALWAEAFKADVGVLLDLALIHPSVMLYVFGGDHSELPQSADAWRHWGHAFAVPQLATLRHLQKAA
ncbi:hypothetical protein [Paenirhodobacter ferrireducens]|nr:hypothetical protein [Sinirhodobacter ferrireducens]